VSSVFVRRFSTDQYPSDSALLMHLIFHQSVDAP
jgi:hypothetical protein